ncbi:tyrosine-protein phosphatase [Pseudomonas sp.]|uniref:tyrosine-protein phosphatase n=1 Tax=unclassified Pseudomonas TaxID=196821 RepID=UPI0031D856E2
MHACSLRSASLLVLPLAVALAAAPAQAETLNTPRLTGIDNFRDVAGTTSAYSTAHDGVMRGGVFYRSNALTPTASDLATLNGLGISHVFDLRTPSEIAGTPDTLPTGAVYENINIIGSSTVNMSLTSAAASRQMMQDMNRAFVTDAGQRAQYRHLFEELAAADDAALFHCTAGKDRTGWTAAMLQSIAGVDSATIMQDYLATNTYTAARTAATLAQLNKMSPAFAAIYQPLLGVESSYLQAGLDQIQASYGSVQNYLTQGLGLDQETLYVLRGKLVRFNSLPGQAGFARNDAAGAGLLAALQDSDLSGHYTAYNYYLQSAIDAGTLSGVESRVGGQIHADAGSYLLREAGQIDDAIAPYASGRDLKDGETRLWMTALASYVGTDSRDGVASSNEHAQGTLIGATHRFSDNLSARAGAGYNWGSLGSAGADADADLALLTVGGRWALEDLNQGLYADLRLDAGWIDYDSKRDLGNGLGTPKGDSNGSFFAATGLLGYRLHAGGLDLEPSIGLRSARVKLDDFHEKGSDLALDVDGTDRSLNSALLGLDIGLANQSLGDWNVAPGVSLGYEHFMNDPQVTSNASLAGFEVEQVSAFDSNYLVKAGLNLKATRGDLSLGAEVKALSGGDSHGVAGTLTAGIAF